MVKKSINSLFLTKTKIILFYFVNDALRFRLTALAAASIKCCSLLFITILVKLTSFFFLVLSLLIGWWRGWLGFFSIASVNGENKCEKKFLPFSIDEV